MAQAILEFDVHPAGGTVGFELGWDFAHHALAPPVEHLGAGSPLHQGWTAGRASFGTRTLAPTRQVRRWLQLRLGAWQRGLAFEGVQVTPNYLRQIDVAWCPITREALAQLTDGPGDATIDRVRDDGGYAAGNLAVMSARANAAKGRCRFDDALTLMRLAESRPVPEDGGPNSGGPDELGSLDSAEWARIAVLCSFVTELPHAQAAGLPLLVLPPNRMRLFNPIQALQALVTRLFGHDGWSARIARIEALLPGQPVRRDFQRFVHALLPRVLEQGRHRNTQAMRWALEDAWRNPLVLRNWSRFANQLSAGQAEQLVVRTGALLPGARYVQAFTLSQATEGWALDGGGYVTYLVESCIPPTRSPRRDQHAMPPALRRAAPVQLAFGG